MKTVNCDFTPAQRLLANGITASTQQLIRALRDGGGGDTLRLQMAERRRMLQELGTGVQGTSFQSILAAMGAAVAESDRTVEELATSHPPI